MASDPRYMCMYLNVLDNTGKELNLNSSHHIHTGSAQLLSVMAIIINWKAVLILLFCMVAFVSMQYYYPVLQARSIHGRRLMNDESCKDLEEQVDYLQALMKSTEQKSMDTLERLRAQNSETRRKLEVQRDIVKDLERRNRQLIDKLSHLESGGPKKRDTDNRLAPLIGPDTIRTLNIRQSSEFEILPYVSFTKDRLYQLDSGMVNKPETNAIGDRKRDLDEVTETALGMLNKDNKGKMYSMYDFSQGYTRLERTVGTQYDLYFHHNQRKNVYEHLSFFRPYAPLQRVQVQTYDKQNEWINLIMPLAGRLETFQIFLEMFAENCIEKDKRVFLTIVYFGEEGKEEAKNTLEKMANENHFSHYKFIEKSGEFSRGVGLLTGAEAWDQGNVLMFFCDVDIYFDANFLERCRLNTAPGSKVYYPIVFSLYNPTIVYSEYVEIPSWREQLVLTRDSGFWRTFGFGMTCMYRSDFLFMRGFDTKIQGWGFEDVKLYRKFAQSNLDVVRSPDGGIFHLWHEKYCNPHLPPAQYNMCLGSKAIGEASPAKLGMMAFKELKKENERLHLGRDDGNQVAVHHADRNGGDNLEVLNKQFDNMDV